MKDDGCSLTFTKVTNPNFIKAVAKSPCITHSLNWEPNIGVQSRKLTKLVSSTLGLIKHTGTCEE